MKKLICLLILSIIMAALVSCKMENEKSSSLPVQRAGMEIIKELLVVQGRLVEDNSCLRLEYSGVSYLLIWPHAFSVDTGGEKTVVIDAEGRIVARVGDFIQVGGGVVSSHIAREIIVGELPADCKGPCYVIQKFMGSDPFEPEPEEASERYAELAEKYRNNPALFDAAVYAEEEGIDIEEAVRRFELMDIAGPLGAELEENEADTFAGFWIEHRPEFRIVAVFTENGEETIKPYLESYPDLDGIIEVRNLEVTLEDLRAAQRRAGRLLEELGLFFDSSINIKENQVEIYVTDSELFYKTLEEADVQLPDHVVVIVVYEPLKEIPFEINPDPSVHFPQLKVHSGSFMESILAGKLELIDDYLRVNGTLIIWQPDYFVHNNEGKIEILDREGNVVGRVGEGIFMGGGEIPFEFVNSLIKEPLPEDCKGPFWLQGAGTRLNLNFSSELFSLELISYGDHEYYFMKKKPPLDELNGVGTKVTVTGKLVANYDEHLLNCPHISVYTTPEKNRVTQCTPIWPSDYRARVKGGVLEIIDGDGQVVVRDGEEVSLEGRRIAGINTEIANQLHKEMPGECYNTRLIVKEVVKGEK